ncbi:MAG: PTS lactose/cellobiose transporter subunit IIA [Breznakia sp.]
MKNTVVEAAMKIILHAGDARVECKQALDAIAETNFTLAKKKFEKAQKEITLAHKVQTDSIQKSMSDEKAEYSLLFAHAQDTLMTIYSEINIAKQLLKICREYDKRLSNLEKK